GLANAPGQEREQRILRPAFTREPVDRSRGAVSRAAADAALRGEIEHAVDLRTDLADRLRRLRLGRCPRLDTHDASRPISGLDSWSIRMIVDRNERVQPTAFSDLPDRPERPGRSAQIRQR